MGGRREGSREKIALDGTCTAPSVDVFHLLDVVSGRRARTDEYRHVGQSADARG